MQFRVFCNVEFALNRVVEVHSKHLLAGHIKYGETKLDCPQKRHANTLSSILQDYEDGGGLTVIQPIAWNLARRIYSQLSLLCASG